MNRIEQIRRSHASARPTPENPAWVHTHADLTVALSEIDRLRTALIKAVEGIQVWHNMGLTGQQASDMWDIYWRNAPEMKLIRDALTGSGDEHAEKPLG